MCFQKPEFQETAPCPNMNSQIVVYLNVPEASLYSTGKETLLQ